MSLNLSHIIVLVSIGIILALIPTALCKTCTKEQRYTYMTWKMDPFTQRLTPKPQAHKRILIVCCEGYTKVPGNGLVCEPICNSFCKDGFCDFSNKRCEYSTTTTDPPTTTTTHRPTTLTTSITTMKPTTTTTSTVAMDPTTTTTHRPTTSTRTSTIAMDPTTTTTHRPTTTSTTTTIPTISMDPIIRQRVQFAGSQKPVSPSPELSIDTRLGSIPAPKLATSSECENNVNCNCSIGYTFDNESRRCRPLCNGKIYGCISGTCIGFNQCRCDEDTYLEAGELFHCRGTHFHIKWALLLLLIPAALIIGGFGFAIHRWGKVRAHRLDAQGESFPEVRLNSPTNHSIDDKHIMARYTSGMEDDDDKAFLYRNGGTQMC